MNREMEFNIIYLEKEVIIKMEKLDFISMVRILRLMGCKTNQSKVEEFQKVFSDINSKLNNLLVQEGKSFKTI